MMRFFEYIFFFGKNVGKKYVRIIRTLKSTIGIDGSKFKAVNSKKNNLNQNKIDKDQQFIKNKIEKYLQEFGEIDI